MNEQCQFLGHLWDTVDNDNTICLRFECDVTKKERPQCKCVCHQSETQTGLCGYCMNMPLLTRHEKLMYYRRIHRTIRFLYRRRGVKNEFPAQMRIRIARMYRTSMRWIIREEKE